MTDAITGFGILAFTVSLSLFRPKLGPIRFHHSTAAVLGALLMLSLRILPITNALEALSLLIHPVITIVSLMVVTLIAEQAGLFDLLAGFIARKANGSGRRLFAYLFLTGTVVGSIFTNDAAVLIFTPLVFTLVEEIQGPDWSLKQKIPFYFCVLYVANVVGGLVISNPINIIVSSLFGVRFSEYAAWMMLPALVSALVSFVGIYVFFRRSIPTRYRVPGAKRIDPAEHTFLTISSAVLALVLIGFFSENFTGIPVWMIASSGALVLCAARALLGRLDVKPLVKGVGWDVIVFVTGIFLVARGLQQIGLTGKIAAILAFISGDSLSSQSFAVGLVSGIASAFLNNHPTADTMSWVIRDMALPAFETKVLALSALIGGDLGPKMLPIGSLAALLWFGRLRKKGVEIPYSLYVKIGVPVTLLAILLSLLVLNLEVALFR